MWLGFQIHVISMAGLLSRKHRCCNWADASNSLIDESVSRSDPPRPTVLPFIQTTGYVYLISVMIGAATYLHKLTYPGRVRIRIS